MPQHLIQSATPSSLPWERVRERATSRKAFIWAVRVLGKVAAIWGMPSPQPSPTGEGAGCSRFRRCRPSEKECPKYQQREFFRWPLSQGRWNKRCERFFRRPLNPSVGCVPQGTHAVGWGCRENGERVRAYRTHPTCGLRLAGATVSTLAYLFERELIDKRENQICNYLANMFFSICSSFLYNKVYNFLGNILIVNS